jgi:poly(3-hydroxybutyrate) depolymerase
LIAFIFICGNLSAATKINTTFLAGTVKHSLFYSIPDNYNPAKKYPLIVGLHYCGGSGNMYRNSLNPLADSLQVIIACPDNSSNVIPDDHLDIVTAAADSARIAYSIDTTAMYLTGMSCNGEFTL